MIEIEEIPFEEISCFWEEHIRYLVDDGIVTDEEDIEYFSGREYRGVMEAHMLRENNRQHMVWFRRGGERIGAASYCDYPDEGGKRFIMDFWVFPAFRGNGTGRRCYEALERLSLSDGAVCLELNSTKEASVRFWRSLGYAENGEDEYGMPLFLKRLREP